MPNKRSTLAPKLVAVVLVLGGVIYAGLYFFRPEAKVARVIHDKAVNVVPGSVDVAAEYLMDLKSEVGGRVIQSDVDVGKKVKDGDFLIQIDPGDLDLDIERTESEYAAFKQRIALGSTSQIALDNAKDLLRNATRMHERGTLATVELEHQQRAVQGIEQSIALEGVSNELTDKNYQNTLKTKRRQREKMRITAQFDGMISKVSARKGDLIGGAAPIATIISSSRIVEAKISEEDWAKVLINQKATVRFLGYGSQLYDAIVVKKLPTAEQETQRYIAWLDVKIDPILLVPGLTGDVNLVIDERNAKAVVPRRAVVGDKVFVLNGGKVEVRPVKTGYVSSNKIEVLEGLTEGDLVIVEEIDTFRDGQRVRAKVVE